MLKRFLPLLAALALCPTASRGAEYTIGGQTFTLPEDLEIIRVAGPPLVQRPISATFDEDGNLYVTDSSGSNDPVEKQLADRPHRVVRLRDTDGDGVFDRSTVFADGLMFPEGILWVDGAVYVGAPPSIWKLTDTDGDGRADEREEWYQGKTLGHCANDLHGPYLGPEGWIYWCKGAFAEQTHERPGLPTIHDRAAHIFRCRPDGSGLESVMSGGMDNPVEVVFTPEGEPIFTSTFIDLSGEGKRDGLGHAVYGGVFPKVNEVTDDVPRTGALLPAMTHFGPGAPCGLARYVGYSLGKGYHDNLFACLFNLHKVTRHVLEPAGATYRTRDSDLLVSSSTDFHPTGVVEDADGSLLIIDTGGWYKLCCPTSQLAKPDVLGAIYRLRKKGLPEPTEPPRQVALPKAGIHPMELAVMLVDPRPAVVAQAQDRLARLGPMGILAITEGLPEWPVPQLRETILWTLARMDAEPARAAIRKEFANPDVSVRQTVAKICGLFRDPAAVPELLPLLETGGKTPQLARVAAEALGRIGDPQAVAALLAAAPGPADRFLEHSFIYALMEIAEPRSTALGLASPRVETKRAALIALNEMAGHPLRPEQVVPLLTSREPLLAETARWIVSRHDDWGTALGDYFRKQLRGASGEGEGREELETLLAQSAHAPSVQQLIADAVMDAAPAPRDIALRAMARSDLKTIPQAWQEKVSGLLQKPDASPPMGELMPALRNFSTRKEGLAPLIPGLVGLARNADLSPDARLDLLALLPSAAIPQDDSVFALLVEQARAGVSPLMRSGAATVLGRMKLTPPRREQVATLLKDLGPLEIGKILPAFESGVDEPLGQHLLAALGGAKALPGLSPPALRAVALKLPQSLRADGEALLARVQADSAAQRQHLETVAAELPPGDVRRGQGVFNGAKVGCTACHRIGHLGGKIGPDLTSIGKIRNERDLLEAIIYPSASFVRSYEPTVVKTVRDEEFMGILRGDTSQAVTLTAGPGAELRLARSDIAEMRPGTVSLMPQGFEQILSRQELADLIAFLKACVR